MLRLVVWVTVLSAGMTGLAWGGDGRRDGHWSDGMHFPPETSRSVSPRERAVPYPSEGMIPNPSWAGAPAHRGGRLSSPESLGYPSEDYSPYQPPAMPQMRRYEYLEKEPSGGYAGLERPYSGSWEPRYPRAAGLGYGSGAYGEGRPGNGGATPYESPIATLPPPYGVAPYAPSLPPTMGAGLYSPYVPSATPYLTPGTPYAAPSPYLQQFGLGANSLLGLMPLSVTGLPFW